MKQTIMIVDDKRANIDMLSFILRDNYSISIAISGDKAIQLLERVTPDLVLLDLHMPDIDGFGVLKYMKANEKLANIPVIFVTGEQNTIIEEEVLELGAVDYIKKPYNAVVIHAKVKNHLDIKAYRNDLELLVQERTRQLEERTRQLEEYAKYLSASREAIIMGMSFMSESHDRVTGEHLERIKAYVSIIANKMLELYPNDITEELADKIILYSPLHDVGKVSIPDNILGKPGALSKEEFAVIKTHSQKGSEFLKSTEYFLINGSNSGDMNVAIEIAEFHHEKYDGSGYNGFKAEEIPMSARITTIADVYDALRSKRPYKEALMHEESVKIILSGDAKTKPEDFDPKVLEIFKLVHNEFDMIYDRAVKERS